MYFAEFLDRIEGTEEEAKFWEQMSFLDMEEVQKALKIPVLGKTLAALQVLYESKNIAEFRASEHFKHVKDWNVGENFFEENGGLSINPSDIHGKKAMNIAKHVAIGLSVAVVAKKIFFRKKKDRK